MRSRTAESAGAGASSVAKGYIRYNASAQKAAFPSIITVAGVLDAIPLEDGNPAIAASGAPMLLDALQVRVQYIVPMHKLPRMSAQVYAAECVCLSLSAFQSTHILTDVIIANTNTNANTAASEGVCWDVGA